MPEVFKALLNPDAYPEKPEKINLIQTHISWIFLTGKYAYKVKKPVNFGFLDFSTLRKRKLYCEREIYLNRMLSPDVYLDVVPIRESGGKIKIGGKGKVVEYAVKMLELPQDSLMSRLLSNGKLKREKVGELARIVADFHRKTESGKWMDRYGKPETIAFNWKENFIQTESFSGKLVSPQDFGFLKERMRVFIKENEGVFSRRIKEGVIKWCHGDLHSGNVFIGDKIRVFDAIEFNPRIACSDVASDVAFMAMDLDFHKREDFSRHFLEKYYDCSGREIPSNLIDFYKCYRSYVRFKVLGIKSFDQNVPMKERKMAEGLAKNYFSLALEYAKRL
ncbi:MAG: hypothetical protein QXN71_00865 [Candidatus Aenigmatarchaeota archaeon]